MDLLAHVVEAHGSNSFGLRVWDAANVEAVRECSHQGDERLLQHIYFRLDEYPLRPRNRWKARSQCLLDALGRHVEI